MNQTQDLANDRAGVYSRPAAYFDGDGALVVRASAASGCRRALWYAAAETEPTNPPTEDVLTVMEAGNALEGVVLRAMERAGWDILAADPQNPPAVTVQIAPNLKVTGHPDATGVVPLFGDEVIVEVKTRGPEAYKRWQTLGAERSHPESVAQAALYSYGSYGDAREVVIATMDTGSRQWDTETIPAERVERALERVRSWLSPLGDNLARNGQDPDALPDRDFAAGSWRCQRCPYLDTCLPVTMEEVRDTETPAMEEKEVGTDEAQAALLAYTEAQDALKEPEQAKRRALDTLKAWMRRRGADKETLEAGGVQRKVSLVTTRRYSVDYKKLNVLLDPETRAGIVTESESEYVRVT